MKDPESARSGYCQRLRVHVHTHAERYSADHRGMKRGCF